MLMICGRVGSVFRCSLFGCRRVAGGICIRVIPGGRIVGARG